MELSNKIKIKSQTIKKENLKMLKLRYYLVMKNVDFFRNILV